VRGDISGNRSYDAGPMPEVSSIASLDHALTAQLIVAWAGEAGEQARLKWWRCDLASEFGGEDLFKRLMPNTWDWAVLQGAREAARRHDAAQRARDHQPDRLLSLFALGFEVDERLDERLQDLKRSGDSAPGALPGLVPVVGEGWKLARFEAWARSRSKVTTSAEPSGRRINGAAPSSLEALVDALVAGLCPVAPEYPLPHFVRSL
jgi:hypothetical protein